MSAEFPNLFLVGAPKCGTTSLYDWLAQHPDIYAPLVKEPTFFSQGLTRRKQLSEKDYLSLYEKREGEKYAIDGSTHNFYDQTAAENIKAASPDAKILIALRHPAEATHSMFHQLRFSGAETMSNFNQALGAEVERREALKPIKRGFPESLLYSEVYALRSNISRFVTRFGRESVKILLLEDVKIDPEKEMTEIYNWLSIDSLAAQNAVYKKRNGAKRPKFRTIQDLAMYPPKWIGKVTKKIASYETRNRFRLWLGKKNTTPSVNPPMDADCRAMLVERHLDDVVWLEEYLQRDLSHWKR